ncbi:DUF2842 domain-containing protein [Aestuariivirga sp.]|uniref:DUF2842 domain-containing protein n=1 Tax=Aestuariivirga sp. TaxID=2650926 RepID=UPI0039E296ED
MRQRTRKFFGMIVTVIFMIIYALVAMAIGGNYAIGNGIAVELAYYISAGLLWVPVVMLLILWMAKPDPTP